ncbi:nidogen-1 [Trichonephila clavipes]|uniref:Nidogen-1 n=1 Tax=Trichonephila clavipes TaxID=2585209 RepID=A0A8X6UYD1_TRICX|nr:nidogen-1 [Trichonephila clavipes]
MEKKVKRRFLDNCGDLEGLLRSTRDEIVKACIPDKFGIWFSFCFDDLYYVFNAVDDPCKEGRQQCGPNSNCVVEGDSFRCVCSQGYQQIYEEDGDRSTSCIDVNECALGRDNCHVFADCLNTPGSFVCRCQPGYHGDGVNCERKQTCADINCDLHADCIGGTLQRPPQCRCKVGYVGDGQTCELADGDDCRSINYCDRRADCLYDEQTHRHTCKCRRGFTVRWGLGGIGHVEGTGEKLSFASQTAR